MQTLTEAGPSAAAPRRAGSARLVVGYLAIAAMLPYLLLKLAWVSGSLVGIADTGKADDPTLFALNVATLGMDLTAVAVVLAFTHSWGLRVPAWAVLLPVWVATGLLVPIVLSAPLVAVAELWSPASGSGGTPFLESWVTPMVYTSFTAQGVGITVAFWLYARSRWAAAFRLRVGARAEGPTQPVYRFGAGIAVLLGVPVATIQLLWATGSTLGLPDAMVDGIGASHYIQSLTSGLLAAGAVAGLLTLVHQWGRGTPYWVPLVATWVGAGAMWTWGAWGITLLLSEASLGGGSGDHGLLTWLDAAQVLAGTVTAMVGVLVTAEANATER